MRTPLASFLALIVIMSGLLVTRMAAAEPAGAGRAVTVTNKTASVVLDNGIVAVEIARDSGNVLALRYQDRSLLASTGYLNWHAGDEEDTDFDDHNSTYGRITKGRFSVKTDPASNGGVLAEICIARSHDAQNLPFDLEGHYALRRGDSGFYAFVVFNHEKGYPVAKISQIRLLFRLKDELFNVVAIDDQRRHATPMAVQL